MWVPVGPLIAPRRGAVIEYDPEEDRFLLDHAYAVTAVRCR
jgi:hypothetical protein